MNGTPAKRLVLFVCHANTSRSVIAEHVMLRLVSERGVEDRLEIRSGGIAPYARDGSLASLDALFVLREIGIHIPRETVATDLKRQRHLVTAADVILVMTDEQRRMLARDFPEAAGKAVHTLKELAGGQGDIDDPAMKEEDVFRHCRDEIVRCLEQGFDRLLET